MKKVFISRDIDEGSKFELFERQGVQLIAQSLLTFEALDFEFSKSLDWLLFYSRNGVKFFAEKVSSIPSEIKLAAVGKKTGEEVKRFFGRIDFVGEGEVDSYLGFFKNVIKTHVLTIVRAENSANTFREMLGGEGFVHEIIPYRNTVKENIPVIKADLYIFTSSMNVEAFFSIHSVDVNAHYLAIGQPTAETLRKNGVEKITISKTPDEDSLWESSLELLGMEESDLRGA